MTNTIVMIHGMWGGGWYWNNYVRYFEARGYRCIAPTLRYHDVDPDWDPHPHLGTTSLIDYVDNLENETADLKDPPILMGHSMGGLLALMLASRIQAKALVLLAPASPYGIMALSP
jgi:pimeloyl-ACP methyl ester carboxylesterase